MHCCTIIAYILSSIFAYILNVNWMWESWCELIEWWRYKINMYCCEMLNYNWYDVKWNMANEMWWLMGYRYWVMNTHVIMLALTRVLLRLSNYKLVMNYLIIMVMCIQVSNTGWDTGMSQTVQLEHDLIWFRHSHVCLCIFGQCWTWLEIRACPWPCMLVWFLAVLNTGRDTVVYFYIF